MPTCKKGGEWSFPQIWRTEWRVVPPLFNWTSSSKSAASKSMASELPASMSWPPSSSPSAFRSLWAAHLPSGSLAWRSPFQLIYKPSSPRKQSLIPNICFDRMTLSQLSTRSCDRRWKYHSIHSRPTHFKEKDPGSWAWQHSLLPSSGQIQQTMLYDISQSAGERPSIPLN